jgi:hypothetical protein
LNEVNFLGALPEDEMIAQDNASGIPLLQIDKHSAAFGVLGELLAVILSKELHCV